MPHPGTHIAVMQALATSTDPHDTSITKLFGRGATNVLNPTGGGNNAADVLKNRYACLGAIGPDLLYFLLDGSEATLGVQDAIIRLYSTFQALDDIGVELGKLRDAAVSGVESIPCIGTAVAVSVELIEQASNTAAMVAGTIKALAEGLIVNESGLNLFSLLPSPRQDGKDPSNWYWADHLHYHRTGVFTQTLLDLALLDPAYKNKPALAAYACAYFTHYVTDTIGHPYVNAIVGGPYRMHRQRHTLVENFIDAVAWQNGFVSGPVSGAEKNPLTGERWIDRPRTADTPTDSRTASFYRSRVHEMIEVGGGDAGTLSSGISKMLRGVADALKDVNTTFGMGGVDFTSDQLFDDWCGMMVQALKQTYSGHPHPTMVNKNDDGFLSKADIKAAYISCFAFLRMATTEPLEEPREPDTSAVTDALKKMLDDLKTKAADALKKIFSPPHIGSGSFSFSALWHSLKKWVEDVIDGVLELVGALVDIIKQLCAAAGGLLQYLADYALYIIQSGLFAIYQAIRRLLEYRAYAQPMDDTVAIARPLWDLTAARAAEPGGNPTAIAAVARPRYPVMEVVESGGFKPPIFGIEPTHYAQDQLFNTIEPALHPAANGSPGVEPPVIDRVMADVPQGSNPFVELFWGKDNMPAPLNMFSPTLLSDLKTQPVAGHTTYVISSAWDLGGIIPNCQRGLRQILANAAASGAKSVATTSFGLPDYNLDGDRGGVFPTWQLVSGSLRPAIAGNPPAFDIAPWEVNT